MLPILMEQLYLTKPVADVFGLSECFKSKGTIPGIVAQVAFNQPQCFSFILDLISEYGVAHFDLSAILIQYMGCHEHGTCKKSCPLKRLLDLGASANGPPGGFVAPIQIAAIVWDLEGIEILLNAGAEPTVLRQTDMG